MNENIEEDYLGSRINSCHGSTESAVMLIAVCVRDPELWIFSKSTILGYA